MDVSRQFNQFAGREVAVTEKDMTEFYKKLGFDFSGVEAHLDENDPVIKELSEAVAKTGLQLRIWLPGTMGTMDYRLDRLNVHVAKEADGKYRIQPGMDLG